MTTRRMMSTMVVALVVPFAVSAQTTPSEVPIGKVVDEPGVFTAMIGYEWTSVPGGNNLHRDVLYRDGKDVADQAFPFTSWQSEDPEVPMVQQERAWSSPVWYTPSGK